MESEEMVINGTIQIGKTKKILLPEKDIVRFLQSIKKCPFCHETELRKIESNHGRALILVCNKCGFQITSSHLYHYSRVEKGMRFIKEVVSKTIQESVKEHERELLEKLPQITCALDRLVKALHSHFAL